MTWLNLVQLSSLCPFNELLVQVVRNEKAWKAWFDAEAPEKAVVPDGYDSLLDQFRKLLLVRSWCPDHTVAQVRYAFIWCFLLCGISSITNNSKLMFPDFVFYNSFLTEGSILENEKVYTKRLFYLTITD